MPNRASGAKENPLQSNPPPRVPRSAFNRSHSHKTTFDSGLLIPLYIDEILPGDSVNLTPSFLIRMATPLRPYIDSLIFDWQIFFCPTRQIWTNFVKQQGERVDPADHNDYTTPQMTAPASVGHIFHSLSDYFTIPTDVADFTHSSLFHRCYNHIWNSWYRDADLQDSVVVDLDDGPDASTDYVVLRRGKRKDYLSGARPFAQRGDAVTIPLGTTAPIVASGDGIPTFESTHANSTGPADLTALFTGARAEVFTEALLSSGSATTSLEWGDPKLAVDLSTATAATINTIRQALATQHVLERDARGGGRYWEVVGAHFGVFPDHIQLVRPELLGTGSMPIQTQQVANQSAAAPSAKGIGFLAAYSVSGGVGRGFTHQFSEHGMLMLLGSVRAELSYQQGLHRMFSRLTRFDMYLPDFATIGEQAVLSKEIYLDDTAADDDVWGYQPRYEEYRHRNSNITGQFRSTYSASLDIWHLGIDFGSRPVLNAAYIEELPPVDRITVLQDPEPEFLCDSYFRITHVRPMPRFGVPGLTRF